MERKDKCENTIVRKNTGLGTHPGECIIGGSTIDKNSIFTIRCRSTPMLFSYAETNLYKTRKAEEFL